MEVIAIYVENYKNAINKLQRYWLLNQAVHIVVIKFLSAKQTKKYIPTIKHSQQY
jgi:hypothetical protein